MYCGRPSDMLIRQEPIKKCHAVKDLPRQTREWVGCLWKDIASVGGSVRSLGGTLWVALTLCAPLCRQGDEQGGHLFFWGGHLGDLHPGAPSPERQPAGHRVRFSQSLPFLHCLPAEEFQEYHRCLRSSAGLAERFDEAKRGHGVRARS